MRREPPLAALRLEKVPVLRCRRARSQSRSIGLATKRVIDSQRPKFPAVLKIFTEKELATGILGGRRDQGVVNG